MATRRGAKNAGKERSGKAANRKTTDQAELVPPTRQMGPESATGAALRAEKEIPSGADRGSQVEIVGGEPQPDAEGPQKPREGQAEPARFTSNGQLPHNMVPSPTGSVPVGAVATTVEDAEKRIEEAVKAHDDFLANKRTEQNKTISAATVNRLGRAELLAIGAQRGYNLPDVVGTRTTRATFLREQEKDKSLSSEEI
jgi:hypothetical protein